MFSKTVRVLNPTGLHARPASQLTELSKGYASNVKIISGKVEINPKSIINILSGGIKSGTEVTVWAEGTDEQKAVNEIVTFIEGLTV
jgi:phosphocarrier protein HPr